MVGEVRTKVVIRSTSDGTDQPMYVTPPFDHDDQSGPTPLVVLLHPWSADLEHRQTDFEDQAMGRGWILIYPDFRGPNDHPDACGSRPKPSRTSSTLSPGPRRASTLTQGASI